ncbi:hypothetical protein ACI65C_004923 [Semiaphis heraclei]
MGKYAKYTRHYVDDWEKESKFKGWLRKATDIESTDNDCKEAYCKVCKVVLRAHHGDLISHAKTTKHVQKTKLLLPQIRPKLSSFDQWLELKTCFVMAAVKEKCESAQILSNMYKDDSNLLYLTFLKPILREVTNVNLLFQSDHADLTKVYGDLKSLLVAASKRIINPNFLRDDEIPTALCVEDVDRVAKALKNKLALLPLDAVDFGYAFSNLANKKPIASKDLQIVKSNYAKFIAKGTSEFWVDVSKLKNCDREDSITDISEFALQILSLPLANACVERVFSIMNTVKTKARNRMQMSTLEAILRLRLHLCSRKICCKDFEPTELMIQKFNSSNDPKSSNQELETELLIDEAMELYATQVTEL